MRWFRRSKRRPGARTRQPATENAETGVLPGEPGGPALEPTRAHPPATPLHKLERGVDSLARWSLRLLIILVAVGVLGFAIGQAWTLVFPLILALILATILWPLAALLRRKLPAALASILTVVGFLAAIVGVFGYIIPTVADQASGMADQVMQGVQGLQERLAGPPFNLDSQRIGELLDSALQWLQDNSQQIASGVLSGVTGVGSALVAIILALVLTFFFLKDGPKFVPWMGRWVGEGMIMHAAELARRVWVTLGGFIWSQAAVALVDAVFIGLGLWLLDIPFALPIAVLIFFAAFIPIVGAVATGALAVVVALVTHDFTRALLVLALILVVQQVEGNVMQPMLVGRTLAMHPAVVLSAVTIGGTLRGIVGAFLAVPVTAVAIVIARYIREAVLEEEPQTAEGEPPGRGEDSQQATKA